MTELSMREEAALIARVRAGEILAAPRDASWYNSPSTSAGPRSHCGGRYHALTAAQAPKCNRRALLVLDLAKPPGDVAEILLCRRAACRAAWQAAAQQPSKPE